MIEMEHMTMAQHIVHLAIRNPIHHHSGANASEPLLTNLILTCFCNLIAIVVRLSSRALNALSIASSQLACFRFGTAPPSDPSKE